MQQPKGKGRLFLFAASFVFLTVGGSLWALWSGKAGLSELRILGDLGIAELSLLVLLCAAIYGTDVLRYRALGSAVGFRIGYRAALDASVANFFFSWVTPGSTFGAPATIFMLGRRGVPWDAAVVIAFGKAFTGVALILLAALVLVGLGLGPDYDSSLLALVLFGGSVFTLLMGAILLAALRPTGAKSRIRSIFARLPKGKGRWMPALENVICRSIDRLAQLRSAGSVVPLMFTHALYFAAFTGVGVVLIVAFGGDASIPAFAATVVYIAFTYIAPTPGGAGFAEAMALPFFGPILPAERAVMMVLCFRAITLCLQVGFGLPYLLLVGGIEGVVARSESREGSP